MKEQVPYLAAAASIALGMLLLWAPPPSLAADPGAVGIALSLITGGFAGLGVTVAIPAATKLAYRSGFSDGRAAYRFVRTFTGAGGPGHPDVGHGHIHLHTKNNVDVELAAQAVRAWGNANLDQALQEQFESVNAMEDPFPPAAGTKRPKGSVVIVEVLLPMTGRHSEAAHLRISQIAGAVENDAACQPYLQPNKVQHWCCWSDH